MIALAGPVDLADRAQEANFLVHDVRPDARYVLVAPGRQRTELLAQSLARLEAVVAPQMHHLVQRADIGVPVALEHAVVVAAHPAPDVLVGLDELRDHARLRGVAPQFVDHAVSPWGGSVPDLRDGRVQRRFAARKRIRKGKGAGRTLRESVTPDVRRAREP